MYDVLTCLLTGPRRSTRSLQTHTHQCVCYYWRRGAAQALCGFVYSEENKQNTIAILRTYILLVHTQYTTGVYSSCCYNEPTIENPPQKNKRTKDADICFVVVGYLIFLVKINLYLLNNIRHIMQWCEAKRLISRGLKYILVLREQPSRATLLSNSCYVVRFIIFRSLYYSSGTAHDILQRTKYIPGW